MRDKSRDDDRLHRVLVKPERAAMMLDVSRATVYRMLATGELEKVRLPGLRIVRIPIEAVLRLRHAAAGRIEVD
jgi:excisionase family DNA binding protein